MKWLVSGLVLLILLGLAWWMLTPVDHADGEGVLSIGSDGFGLVDPGVYSIGIQPCTGGGRRAVVHEVGLDNFLGEVTLLGVMERTLPAGSSGVGAVAGFPPNASDVPEADWETFQRLVVSHDCADPSGPRPEIVVGIEFGQNGGIVDGISVRYRSGLRVRTDHATFQIVHCGPAVSGLHQLCGG